LTGSQSNWMSGWLAVSLANLLSYCCAQTDK